MTSEVAKKGFELDVECESTDSPFYRSVDVRTRMGKSVMIEVCFDTDYKAYTIRLPGWPGDEAIIIQGGQEEATEMLNFGGEEAKLIDSPLDLRKRLEDEAYRRAESRAEEESEAIPQTLRSAGVEEVRRRLKIV